MDIRHTFLGTPGGLSVEEAVAELRARRLLDADEEVRWTGKPDIAAPDSPPVTKLSLPSTEPAEPMAAAESGDTSKRLSVGEGIQLKGEITACERLIVEGQVEVTREGRR